MNTKHELNIILPKFYNNGKKIEKAKFDQTFKEFIDLFGAYTLGQEVIGTWKDSNTGKVYTDKNITVQIIFNGIKLARLSKLKEDLKSRFDQLEIFMTLSKRDIILI